MQKAIGRSEHVDSFLPCHVVVVTSSMMSAIPHEVAQDFVARFEVILFDEAHHLAAPTWDRIISFVQDGQKIVAVTATPFRNDGKKIPGEMIYQFPLRMAQQQNYFRKIDVLEIDEHDESRADELIAEAAVNSLKADEQEHGWLHIIMARAKSIKHAEHLYSNVYKKYSDLNPIVIHSKTTPKEKKRIVEALRVFAYRIVICVDMLGEGFDLPALKIAAMHELHKSLPVTIQFIGRFTRAADRVGKATLIVNVARADAVGAVAELYEEDADWNELLPHLSSRAIKSEEDIEVFAKSLDRLVTPDEKVFDIGLIRPSNSVVMYSVKKFTPKRFKRGLTRDAVVHQVWQRDEDGLLVLITQERFLPDWSHARDANDVIWKLYIASHDESRGLLYLYVSDGGGRIGSMAKALAGGEAVKISGEDMFRALHGLNRTILSNVGLYRKGRNVSFQMHVGIDVADHVNSAAQAGSAKSNLFATGFEDGQKTSIGVSFKGRAWTMASSSIPDWEKWCRKIASKVRDPSILTDGFLEFVLTPQKIDSLPELEVYACVPPEIILSGGALGGVAFNVEGDDVRYEGVDVSINYLERRGGSIIISVEIGLLHRVELQLQWIGGYKVSFIGGPSVRVYWEKNGFRLEEFLLENPPVVLMNDGSEVMGGYHFTARQHHPYTFSPSSIVITDWGNTPLNSESKWKAGVKRKDSIQGFMIEKCKADKLFDFIIDDDDAQEAADIIGISVDESRREIEVTLFHCKYASGKKAGARVKDLYEVCGQAVKSTRLVHRPDYLLEHIFARERRLGGRSTRFEKGDPSGLRSLRRVIHKYRVKTQVAIVQPGLSVGAFNTELSSILGGADNFIFEFTGRRLKVFGSA
jgi:hypothetical protein